MKDLLIVTYVDMRARLVLIVASLWRSNLKVVPSHLVNSIFSEWLIVICPIKASCHEPLYEFPVGEESSQLFTVSLCVYIQIVED